MNTVALTHYPNRAPAQQNGFAMAAMLMARRIRRHLKARSDRRALLSMPDHILADIGISRSGIERSLAYGRLYDGRR